MCLRLRLVCYSDITHIPTYRVTLASHRIWRTRARSASGCPRRGRTPFWPVPLLSPARWSSARGRPQWPARQPPQPQQQPQWLEPQQSAAGQSRLGVFGACGVARAGAGVSPSPSGPCVALPARGRCIPPWGSLPYVGLVGPLIDVHPFIIVASLRCPLPRTGSPFCPAAARARRMSVLQRRSLRPVLALSLAPVRPGPWPTTLT